MHPAKGELAPLFFWAACFAVLSVGFVPQSIAGHNHQRLLVLLAVAGITAVGFILRSPRPPVNFWLRAWALLFALGLLSASLSRNKAWALTELALLATLAHSAWVLAAWRTQLQRPWRIDLAIYCMAAAHCLAIGLGALVKIGVLATAGESIGPWQILTHYSNIRMLGYVSTWLLPLLAWPLLWPQTTPHLRAAAWGMLGLWWYMVLFSGTRGAWLGMGVAIAAAACLGPLARSWAAVQFKGLLGGLALYAGVWLMVTPWLGNTTESVLTNRVNDSLKASTVLSAREHLLQQSWAMITERPWLGHGPMHFADVPIAIAAHPHNSVLQIATEWGLPAALLFVGLMAATLYSGARALREAQYSSRVLNGAPPTAVCAYFGIAATACQSLVNGNLSEPNSQLWMVMTLGLWIGTQTQREAPSGTHTNRPRGLTVYNLVLASACAWLLWVAVRDVPQLRQMEQQYLAAHGAAHGNYLKPRFWLQGMIHE